MASLPSFDESGVETSMLRWLGEIGWEVYGLSPDEKEGAKVLDDQYDRDHDEAVYWELLKEKLIEINDLVTPENVSDVITTIKRDFSQDRSMEANREVHDLLRKGRQMTLTKADGETERTIVQLIDHENPSQNSFIAVNQLRFQQTESVRPDTTLLVNGLPLVMGEVKSLTQDATVSDAISDLREYEKVAPRMFASVLFNIAADHEMCRYGAVGATENHYYPWRPEDLDIVPDNEFKATVYSLLRPDTLLDILKHYVFYQAQPGGDAKIVPRHMQYYAGNAILDRVSQEGYKNGLVWHTQGSGKSFTMLFTARNLLYRSEVIKTPQVLILVDRDNLREQMQDDLGQLINFDHYEVITDGGGQKLQRLIEEGKSEVIVTTIQLFQNVEKGIQSNPNTVVLSDEAHRFMEKKLGNKLDAALDQYYHIGFTGTPVNENRPDGRNTFQHYAAEEDENGYLHRYSMEEGIQDEIILPVHYKTPDIEFTLDSISMDKEHESEFSHLTPEQRDNHLRREFNQRTLAELRPYVEEITEDIADHYQDKLEPSGWKGMVVTPSRKAAALFGEELQKLLGPDEVDVMISSTGDDDPLTKSFATSKDEREQIVEDFKEEDEKPNLIVVCDMLLTGFDAPILKTIYLNRPLQNHTLLQAIARTNRTATGKHNGEIIDYARVFSDEEIDDTLSYYEPSVRQSAARESDELLERYTETLEEVMEIFDDIEMDNDPETLTKCLTLLRKNPEKLRKFKTEYRKAEKLYDTIAPDGRLEEPDLAEKYTWITQVHLAYQRTTNRNEEPEEDLREKTKQIVAANIDVEMLDRAFEVREISGERLEEIEMLEPEEGIPELEGVLKDHLGKKKEKNPKYERLSDRVKEVVKNWRQGSKSDVQAFEELQQIGEEALEIEEEAEQRDLSPAGYALYAELVDEYQEFLTEEEAEALARDVENEFNDRVDTSYAGWKTSVTTRDTIQQILLEKVAVEHEKPKLCKQEDFLDDARQYLIDNA